MCLALTFYITLSSIEDYISGLEAYLGHKLDYTIDYRKSMDLITMRFPPGASLAPNWKIG